jgi:pilus assembly protein CpaC
MLRSTIILAAITAISFVVANRTLPVPQLRIISSDTKARFLEVHINKAVTIDLPRDVKEVFVGDAKIVTVVVRTMRRIYIVGAVLGNTNVLFYDDDGGQIAALDVCVSDHRRAPNDASGSRSQPKAVTLESADFAP